MRRLEILEAKEQGVVNQVNPPQMTNPCCTYCHTLNYVFKECPVYLAQQMLSGNMNAAFAKLNNNPYFKTYTPGWRKHPNFSWSQNSHEQCRPNLHNQFPAHNYQSNFQPKFLTQLSTKFPTQLSAKFQVPQHFQNLFQKEK